jgi:hypothetical protein
MTALYILANEYRAAAERLADLDLDEQTVADTLEGLSGELEAKATNVAMFARNLEATAVAIKEAEAGMAARRKAIENRAAGLRRYLLGAMQSTGISKIETPHMVLSIRNNPESVDIFDAAQVPAEYMRQPEPPPPAPDKTAIKAAIKSGHDVPGAKLTQSQRLEVR